MDNTDVCDCHVGSSYRFPWNSIFLWLCFPPSITDTLLKAIWFSQNYVVVDWEGGKALTCDQAMDKFLPRVQSSGDFSRIFCKWGREMPVPKRWYGALWGAGRCVCVCTALLAKPVDAVRTVDLSGMKSHQQPLLISGKGCAEWGWHLSRLLFRKIFANNLMCCQLAGCSESL